MSQRSLGVVVLAAALWLAGGHRNWLPAPPPPPPPKAPAIKLAFPSAPVPDSTLADNIFPQPERSLRQWMRNAERLLKEERYREAVLFLQKILESKEDFFQPSGEGEANSFSSFKSQVQGWLGSMPAKGRELFELQHGQRAQDMLDRAVANGDIQMLRELMRVYFHTKAGYQAAYLLGRHHLDKGEPTAAAICFERLKRSPATGEFEPMLSLNLAASWRQAGLQERGVAVLLDLKKSRRGASLNIPGGPIRLFANDGDALPWLARVTGRAAPTGGGGGSKAEQWVMYRGDASRTALSPGGKPLMNPRWRLPVSNDPEVLRLAVELQRKFHDRQVAALPCSHPLVVSDVVVQAARDGKPLQRGDLVLVRTSNSILAIDFDKGRRIWHVERAEPKAVTNPMTVRVDPFGRVSSASNPDGIEQRLWTDSTYGLMSSDGQRVYIVEPPVDDPSADSGVTRFDPTGRRITSASGATNRLQARDLKSSEGKLVWEIGGVEQADDSPLKGAFFLGPPLPLDGTLYTLIELKSEMRLAALSAADGKLLWSQQLAVANDDDVRSYGRSNSRAMIRRMSGVTPSHADGVLVCPTSVGAVVAVDLTNRSLRWGYKHPVARYNYSTPSARLQSALSGRASGSSGAWADSSVTIAGGRVLLTPAMSPELLCLTLVDGKKAWSIPREDGLYVACVHRESAAKSTILVVGASSVRAYRLASGKSPWLEPMALPADTAPSGRGFYNGKHYFLPLSNGKIAVIDLVKGDIIEEISSPGGRAAGNLVCFKNSVISQSGDFVDCFHQIEPLKKEVETRLAQNADDAPALALKGEILLHEGKLNESIGLLRKSYRLDPDPRTRHQLVHGLLEGMRADFAKHREAALEVEKLLTRRADRAEYLRLLARGLQEQGAVLEAFAAFQKLAELQWDETTLHRVDRHTRVRRDRWIRAGLAALYQQSDAEQRKLIDERIEQRRTAAGQDAAALRRFVGFYGGHPAADRARQDLVSLLLKDPSAGRLEIEMLLNRLEQSEATRRRWAVAQKAGLFRNAGRLAVAAKYYRRLRDDFADDICLDGKTGRELSAAAAEDEALRTAAKESRTAWPAGEVKTEAENISINSNRMYSISQRRLPGAAPKWTLHWDTSRYAVVARDELGRPAWSVSTTVPGRRSMYINASVNEAVTRGNLIIVTLGHEVLAIDTLAAGGAKLLWRRSLTEDIPGLEQLNRGIGSRMERRPWGQQQSYAIDPMGRPTGMVGLVTDDVVCFQRVHDLEAIDPLTGKTLWKRLGLTPGSLIFGDEELVFVLPPDSEQALVLRASDGHEVGRRKLFGKNEIMATRGRRMLLWKVEETINVRLVDAFDGKVAWEHKFDRSALAHLVDGELAVMQRDGKFALLNADSGQRLFDSQLDADASLAEIYLLPSSDHWLVMANSSKRRGPAVGVSPVPGGADNPRVNGKLYGLAREGGKLLWKQDVENQGLLLNQPADLPLLVFASQTYFRRIQHSVHCIDKRTGKKVYALDAPNSVYGYQVIGDPKKGEITLHLTRSRVTIRYAK